MTLLVSILVSVLVCGVVIGVLSWVRTPHYQPQRQQVVRLLEWVVLEQASSNDWRIFCEIPIRHDPLLEDVRQRCLDIDERCFLGAPHLLSRQGVGEVRALLEEMRPQLESR